VDVGWSLPFILGDLRVVPRKDPVFSRSGDFAVYFQLALPPGTATGHKLEMRFFRKEGESFIPAGHPQVLVDPRPAQGLSFPLSDWPAGAYRLVVTLQDPAGVAEATRSMDFRVDAH
jgi:hypothetical protein